jgi:type III pantothenate kinase
MNIAIDIGNTQIKTGVYEGDTLIQKEIFPSSQLASKLSLICSNFKIRKGILSHVSRLSPADLHTIESELEVLILNNRTKVPFSNLYSTPQTLGVDRIALAAAAVSAYPGEDVLVVDAGTCITYDYVNKRKEYLGGAISPGIEMRYKAMNAYTANLPLLSPVADLPPVGDSTSNAIHRGVLNGVICEIDGTIAQYAAKKSHLTVVLTGGDVNFLANNIKSSIFAIPNFLLDGLNSILIHNIEE